MKKESGFYADSLEMMLDTMCNMLGAVIFIALMVALMPQDSDSPPPAQDEAQAAQLSNDLAAITASNSVAAAEIANTLLRLQDPRWHAVTNIMRLPNVTGTGKQEWRVIISHGKLYPLKVLSADGRGKALPNFRTLNRQAVGGEVKLEVRPEMGDEPESGVTEMVNAFRASHKTDYFFSFWVYEDSFEAFMVARETAMRLGFQYGWKPLPQNKALKLGAVGEHILPQN